MSAPRRVRAFLSVGMAGLVLAGCARDREREGAQPAPDVTTFEQGRFDDLPLFPRSDPVGPRSEKEGVVTRSFVAKGATPEQVMQFYEGRLKGWQQVEPSHLVGTSTHRAKWALDNWFLEVSASAYASSIDDPLEAQVQYSLVLSPR